MSTLIKCTLCPLAFLFLAPMGFTESLRVQVLDSMSGAPVEATVSAIGAQPRLDSARTDEKGVAVLEVNSLHGLCIIVNSPTHGEKCLGEDETKGGNLVVRLEPSLRVFGVVRDPNGNPVPGATVKVVYTEDQKCRLVFYRSDETTNDRGEYALRNVDIDRGATIIVQHEKYAEQSIRTWEITSAPSGAVANTKELNLSLSIRP